jgi:hypothetical protein
VQTHRGQDNSAVDRAQKGKSYVRHLHVYTNADVEASTAPQDEWS